MPIVKVRSCDIDYDFTTNAMNSDANCHRQRISYSKRIRNTKVCMGCPYNEKAQNVSANKVDIFFFITFFNEKTNARETYMNNTAFSTIDSVENEMRLVLKREQDLNRIKKFSYRTKFAIERLKDGKRTLIKTYKND